MRTADFEEVVYELQNVVNKQDTIIANLANVVSTVNSSTTPLGIGGVFTGTAEDVTKYAAVTVMVKSDRASATDGLSIQFSSDGTNWDNVNPHTTVAATTHVTTDAVHGKYFRVVYTNGATAQTYFRLQVIYSTESIGPVIEEMGGDVNDTTSAITSKSVLFAKNPGGVYGAINRTTGGNLKVSFEEVEAGVVIPTRDQYGLYATEYGATYNYIAKEDASGAWFIQRETISSGVREYVAGASAVATAWTNRASQTYGLYSAAF